MREREKDGGEGGKKNLGMDHWHFIRQMRWLKCPLAEQRRCLHSLDIRALVADHLLGHLEAAGAQLGGPHLLPAVALPFARGLPCHGFVSNHLASIHTGSASLLCPTAFGFLTRSGLCAPAGVGTSPSLPSHPSGRPTAERSLGGVTSQLPHRSWANGSLTDSNSKVGEERGG